MEHLLSALEACGVDNARIESEGGPEVPIIDGSALSWALDLHAVRLLHWHHQKGCESKHPSLGDASGCKLVAGLTDF